MAKVHALFLWPLLAVALAIGASSCKGNPVPPAEHVKEAEEVETLARTEFTERVENFFEYEELKAGRSSQFLIHLTDLSDGYPVEKANVSLTARSEGKSPIEITAKVGRVTGIYVANLTLPSPGEYEIEFHIKNAKLDERVRVSGFEVK